MSSRNKIEIILLIGFIIFLVTYYTHDYYEKSKINSNKGQTIGKIIEYYVIFPESHYLIYQYLVNGISYTKKVSTSITFPKCIEDRKCIGQMFLVEYDKANPFNSVIDLNKPR